MTNEPIALANIYLMKNNTQFGPYHESEVMELLKTEQFTLNNLACYEGMNQWIPLGAILQNANRELPFVPPPNWLSQVSVAEAGLFAGVFIAVLLIPTIILSLMTQTLRVPGVLLWIIASAIAGWAVSHRLKKKMSAMLGREVRSDMELTSISNWMEIASKEDKTTKK